MSEGDVRAEASLVGFFPAEKKHRAFLSKALPFLLSCLFLAPGAFWMMGKAGAEFRGEIKKSLMAELVDAESIGFSERMDVLYVLGGNQDDLEIRLATVSSLYHQGVCARIWILSEAGSAEFSAELGRNLTNDEWAARKLQDFGVPQSAVEFKDVKIGFFGTLSEAEGVSELLMKKAVRSIGLVSSSYHTRRVRLAFQKLLDRQGITFFVMGADQTILLRHALLEFGKLKIYQWFLVR